MCKMWTPLQRRTTNHAKPNSLPRMQLQSIEEDPSSRGKKSESNLRKLYKATNNTINTMSTSIRISKKTKRRLIQVRGKLEIKNGKNRSIEDVINKLIDRFEEEKI